MKAPYLSERIAIRNAIARCTNPNHKFYKDYGGRGITVCSAWINDWNAFIIDMGPKPSPGHQLDRKDNDQGYFKENCRWVTHAENNQNKRNTIWVEYGGKTIRLREASVLSGIKYRTLFDRWVAGDVGPCLFRVPSHSSREHAPFRVTPTRAPA